MKSSNRTLVGLLSFLIPGLGQMAAGHGARGAAILVAVIVVGNLNAIWLSLYALTSSATPIFWAHTLPFILHRLFAAYGIVFWIWQVLDAVQLAKDNYEDHRP